jgi:2-oxoglutarate dehydrogenase E2 component (dihydrolipoamide succinyltransferase)
MATDVKVPALGESITEGTLAQWLKKPGEAVAQDEPIASLETDKVTVDVPSPVAGTLAEQMFNEGDTVEVGAIIARIGEGGAAAAPSAP